MYSRKEFVTFKDKKAAL